MIQRSYPEVDLVANRTSVLLFGGTVAERRAWAEEARQHLGDEPWVEVIDARALAAALTGTRGVIFVPDVLALGLDAQRDVLRCLIERDERPKLVLALQRSPDDAASAGLLRDDLLYRLRLARVDLRSPETQAAIAARREAAARTKKPAAVDSARKPSPAGRTTRRSKPAHR